MLILRRTSQILMLRIFPVEQWLTGLFPIAVFLVLFIIYGGTQSILTCHRTAPDQGRCQLVASRLFQSKVQLDIPLSQVKEATSNSRGSQVSLVTDDGAVFRLTTYAIPVSEENASRINEFLNRSEQRYLKVIEGKVQVGWHPLHDWLRIPLVIVFSPLVWVCGGIFIYGVMAGKIVTCTFDQTRGKVIIERRGIRSFQRLEYPLEDIVGVEVDRWKTRRQAGDTMDVNGRLITLFRVNLILRSGDRAPISKQFSQFHWGKERLADCIRQFLNL